MSASLSQVERLEGVRLGPGDVVAVRLPPGPEWVELVRGIWRVDAALFPVDVRLPVAQAADLLHRARPTVILDPDGWKRPRGGRPAPEGVALVVHTSGTAGEPKLVQFRMEAIEHAVSASAAALGATRRDRWLCCLPLAHVGGLLALLRGVLGGAPVAVHERFDPPTFAAEPDVAFVSVVPTMLARLLDAGVDLGRFRAILVGGAHLARELRDRAEAAGARLVQTYGLTESCGGVVYEGVPLPSTEVRVARGGGVELRGPTLMLGYRFDPAGTRRAFAPDGWLRSGDVGRIDPDGRLHVLGRADGLIKSGGERVWPEEVEAVLRGHPKVGEVAVAGRPDADWGERVVAFVVPSDPAHPPTLDELRGFAGRRLPRHSCPRQLTLVDALPRTGSGKVRRSALPGLE